MKKFLINLFFLMIAIFSGVALFTLKYQVKEKETELKSIHANILKTKTLNRNLRLSVFYC